MDTNPIIPSIPWKHLKAPIPAHYYDAKNGMSNIDKDILLFLRSNFETTHSIEIKAHLASIISKLPILAFYLFCQAPLFGSS